MLMVEVTLELLQPGWLWEQFNAGVHVVRVELGSTVTMMWDKLVKKGQEVLPWEAPLADLAVNHHGSQDITTTIGDVFYFQPRIHGYIGRKLLIEIDEAGNRKVSPPSFRQGEEWVEPPREAIDEACRITQRIMTSLTPIGGNPPKYQVSLQRLKYQHSVGEFESLARMTHNSMARWSRFGSQIDRNRGELNQRMSGRKVSDVLGLMMELPGGRALVSKVSSLLGPPDNIGGITTVERAHRDERYFSALCGERQTVRTEIFADGKWHPLPVDLDHLIIFPGNIAARQFDLPPVLHRVVYPSDCQPAEIDSRSGNVTMLIGAV